MTLAECSPQLMTSSNWSVKTSIRGRQAGQAVNHYSGQWEASSSHPVPFHAAILKMSCITMADSLLKGNTTKYEFSKLQHKEILDKYLCEAIPKNVQQVKSQPNILYLYIYCT